MACLPVFDSLSFFFLFFGYFDDFVAIVQYCDVLLLLLLLLLTLVATLKLLWKAAAGSKLGCCPLEKSNHDVSS